MSDKSPMIVIQRNYRRIELEYIFFSFIILFYLFRTAIPVFKYPFLVLCPGFILFLLIKYKSNMRKTAGEYLRNFSILLILAALLILAFFLSNKFYLIVFKDIINISILFILFFCLALKIRNREQFAVFSNYFIKIIVYTALIIAIFDLYVFFNPIADYETESVSSIYKFLASEAALVDYNFALLPVFYGIIGILNFLSKTKSRQRSIFYNLILLIFTIQIVLSGSRRGLFALLVLILLLILTQIIALLRKDQFFRKLSSVSLFYVINSVILITLIFLFIFQLPAQYKTKVIQKLNSDHVYTIKRRTAERVFSYITALNASITFDEIYDKIWISEFDPLNPSSGWGLRNHKEVFPLDGENVEIVPENSIGYYLDNMTNASTWDNNAYSYTLFKKDSLNKGELFHTSVFCYISPDFNGNWARIYAIGATRGNNMDEYDMEKKGIWQKLSFTGKSDGGLIEFFLYFAQYNQSDFKNLKGYVIFAYPQFERVVFDPKDPETWATRRSEIVTDIPLNQLGLPDGTKGCMMNSSCDVSTWSGNAYSYILVGKDSIEDSDQISASVFCYVSEDFNGSWVRLSAEGAISGDIIYKYDLSQKGTWQKLTLHPICNNGEVRVYLYFAKYGVTDFSLLSGYIIFAYPIFKVTKSGMVQTGYIKDTGSFHPDQVKINDITPDKNNNNSLKKSEAVHVDDPGYQISWLEIRNSENNMSFTSTYSFRNLPFSKFLLIEDDPFRNWLSNFFNEDTVYQSIQERIIIDTLNNEFIGSRIQRWQFAWQIYKKEYNWTERFFGGGFDYLDWFGSYFYKGKRVDWPHNPFLSVLLYSGIIGLCVYVFSIFKAFQYFNRYFISNKVLLALIPPTFFFTFFSGKSPFDPPLMGFLFMLLFFIHYIRNRRTVKS